MATPPTAATFRQWLRDEGVTVVEVYGWESRNRNAKGPWGPVHGVMIHHTVTRGTANTVKIVRDGYAALPGPLCHGMIAKDGKVHLVGYGRANHAGLGDPDVLRAVIAETRPPADNEATVDGNRAFYGFECENLGDGKDPWPEVQIEAIVRVIAALARHHKWSARSAIRHLDWQPGKVDPRGPGMDWDDVLSRVTKRLAGASTPPQPTGPALPKPTKPVVDLSKLIAAAKSDPARSGTPVTYAGVKTVEAALVDAGLLSKTYSDGHYGTSTVAAYAAWQKRLGYTGKDADGIPGKTSLTKLGDKHGFQVIA
ncbi:N-acetylmuramoyl-L-alanine amidase [Streptomyces sp. LRE541]|uniref:N-acetylmuramoyl-L-alanine amidase n=1 Tax=Streptomyces sp. LRE541 TaxID=2931983 RepID=UPI00200D6CD7|nr:N-acetylmuramoyl-L-alanine amidase [Streptomyces sp. LRE541]UPZ27608.1 N-acetylmuramoyl-L-alanine amidase [Streptomyces sp. LRE541]